MIGGGGASIIGRGGASMIEGGGGSTIGGGGWSMIGGRRVLNQPLPHPPLLRFFFLSIDFSSSSNPIILKHLREHRNCLMH